MTCSLCNDIGAIYTYNTKDDVDEIQRCDDCKIYNSDEQANDNFKKED
jgi:hypothetical protein